MQQLMQSYLITGKNMKVIEECILSLLKKYNAKSWEHPLKSISDVRELEKITRLQINQITAIILKDVDQASLEALNAFLKNLEEPQENLFYLLTAGSIGKVIPTVVSRCLVIKTSNKLDKTPDEKVPEFFNLSKDKQLTEIEKVKGKNQAVTFVKSLLTQNHQLLLKSDYRLQSVDNYAILYQTLGNLEYNGNVNLQLTNMVLGLV